jgi:hypothetical protein
MTNIETKVETVVATGSNTQFIGKYVAFGKNYHGSHYGALSYFVRYSKRSSKMYETHMAFDKIKDLMEKLNNLPAGKILERIVYFTK